MDSCGRDIPSRCASLDNCDTWVSWSWPSLLWICSRNSFCPCDVKKGIVCTILDLEVWYPNALGFWSKEQQNACNEGDGILNIINQFGNIISLAHSISDWLALGYLKLTRSKFHHKWLYKSIFASADKRCDAEQTWREAREYRGMLSRYFPERRPLARGAPETRPRPANAHKLLWSRWIVVRQHIVISLVKRQFWKLLTMVGIGASFCSFDETKQTLQCSYACTQGKDNAQSFQRLNIREFRSTVSSWYSLQQLLEVAWTAAWIRSLGVDFQSQA